MTPIKAIRAKCLECSNGQYSEVRACPATDCPLYAYRFGHRPKGNKEPAEAAFEEKCAGSAVVLRKKDASNGSERNEEGETHGKAQI